MLIYVDKKKERRRKIKIFCIILFTLIFISLNVSYYYKERNHGEENLSSYQKITYQNAWYDKSSPIYIFNNKDDQATTVIITPAKITREVALTLANAFLKLPPQNYKLTITDEIKDAAFLQQIFENTAAQNATNTLSADIILTSDYSKIETLIHNLKLYPKMVDYTKSQKLSNKTLNDLLDKQYPPLYKPQTKIEKEQKALNEFAKENQKELFDLIINNIQPRFSKQSTFLKNTRLCLQNKDFIQCQMQTDTSLLLNIKNALQTFPKNIQPQKLLLLSSNERINPTDVKDLKDNEGLYFSFDQRKAYLLPHEISALTIEKEPLYILKEKAGFNPEYTSPLMELYKFNVTEVNLDEEI